MNTRRRAPMVGVLLAAVAAASLSPAPALAQQEAPEAAAPEVSQERLSNFVRAHVAISEARDAFQQEVARIHDTLGREQARAALEEQLAAIMAEHQVTPEEYQQITLLISMNAETRARFEQILSEVVQSP